MVRVPGMGSEPNTLRVPGMGSEPNILREPGMESEPGEDAANIYDFFRKARASQMI